MNTLLHKLKSSGRYSIRLFTFIHGPRLAISSEGVRGKNLKVFLKMSPTMVGQGKNKTKKN